MTRTLRSSPVLATDDENIPPAEGTYVGTYTGSSAIVNDAYVDADQRPTPRLTDNQEAPTKAMLDNQAPEVTADSAGGVATIMNLIKSTVQMTGSYDGSNEPREHLNSIENCFYMSALPQSEWVKVACGSFRGEAAAWAISCSETLRTSSWAEFRRIVLLEFETDKRGLLTRLSSLTPIAGQLRQFAIEFRRLRRGITGISEGELVELFLSRLPRAEQLAIRGRAPTSVAEAVGLTLTMCSVSEQQGESRCLVAGRRGVGTKNPYSREHCERHRLCYLCGADGHLSNQCPDRRQTSDRNRSRPHISSRKAYPGTVLGDHAGPQTTYEGDF